MASSRLLPVIRWGQVQQLHRFRSKALQPYQDKIFCGSFYSTSPNSNVSVSIRDGLPIISMPLPSRNEQCQFTLKPVSQTVGDLLRFMKEEDGGIDRSAVYTSERERIAKSTFIGDLLKSDFLLVINDSEYKVSPPSDFVSGLTGHEDLNDMSDVKTLIAQLYSSLDVNQHMLQQETKLLQDLEDLKMQLAPMEKIKLDLERRARKRTSFLSWSALGLMGIQFGFLARLTWWEYSWDIMEPVTYFVTYGTTMAMFAYFVLTKQEYNFEAVRDRQHLISVYGNADSQNVDIQKYNDLKNAIAKIEFDIQRLRDPLQNRLPLRDPQMETESS